MPAVSKGEGMRGLAVFISDIRNCECQTPGGPERGRGRGSAGAAAGLEVRPRLRGGLWECARVRAGLGRRAAGCRSRVGAGVPRGRLGCRARVQGAHLAGVSCLLRGPRLGVVVVVSLGPDPTVGFGVEIQAGVRGRVLEM